MKHVLLLAASLTASTVAFCQSTPASSTTQTTTTQTVAAPMEPATGQTVTTTTRTDSTRTPAAVANQAGVTNASGNAVASTQADPGDKAKVKVKRNGKMKTKTK